MSLKSLKLSSHAVSSHVAFRHSTSTGTTRPFAMSRCVSSLNATTVPKRNAETHFTCSCSDDEICLRTTSITPNPAIFMHTAPLR